MINTWAVCRYLFFMAIVGAIVLPAQSAYEPEAIHKPHNAALNATSTANVSVVTRDGYAVPGDSPPVQFVASNSPCSLNSGDGDGGSQVKSANNKCWIGVFQGGQIDVRQFGATVSPADSTAAFQAAHNVNGYQVVVPPGTWNIVSPITPNLQSSFLLRPGAITTPGNLYGNNPLSLGRGLHNIMRATPPSSFGDWSSITNAFIGDLSGTLTTGKTLTGTSVGGPGAPATGYSYHQENNIESSYLYNTSGNNQSTTNNDGRTAAINKYGKTDQYGQGDAVTFWCDQIVASTRSGATNWLASPAASCLAGQTFGAANGAFLQGTGDINLVDSGFDVAGFSDTRNLTRTNAAGNINTNWIGSYYASTGTKPIDAFYHVGGPTRFGVDLTATSYPDVTLAGLAILSGGAGYTVGDIVTVSGGTADQATRFKIVSAPGGIVGVNGLAIERAGLYSVAPGSPNSPTGGTGTGLSLTLQYNSATAAPAMVTTANQCWYGNATRDSGVFGGSLPSTTYVGGSYMCYSSALGAWLMVSEGSVVGEFFSGASGVIIPQVFSAKTRTVAKTVSYAVTTSDFGTHFSNAGAPGAIAFVLPTAAAGLNFCFLVATAQSVELRASGTDTFLIGTSASSAGGAQTATTVGSSVCIESHFGSRWFTTSHEGAWVAS